MKPISANLEYILPGCRVIYQGFLHQSFVPWIVVVIDLNVKM